MGRGRTVTMINNGESGLSVRTKINAAFATIEADSYATRADFIAATTPADVTRTAFFVNGNTHAVVRDAAGPIAQSNGQKWRPDGDVTPQHFGAVGDGVTDDTSSVQAAIDFADTVYCGSGLTYLVSGLTIPRDNVAIIGGPANRPIFFLDNGANSHVFFANNRSDCVIQDIIVDGNKENQGLGSDNPWRGIYFVNTCHNLSFNRVLIQNVRDHGFNLSSGSDNAQRCGKDSTFTDCEVQNSGSQEHLDAGGPGGTGFAGGDSTTVWTGCVGSGNRLNGFKAQGVFIGCHSIGNGGGFETGFVLENSLKYNKYIGCSAVENDGDGFRNQGAGDQLTFIGCHAEGNGTAGITFINSVDKAIIQGCWFRNNGQADSDAYTGTRGYSGIFVSGTSSAPQGIVISSCHFLDDQATKTQRHHIYVGYDGSDVVISDDNVFGPVLEQPIYITSGALASPVTVGAAKGLVTTVRQTTPVVVTGTTSSQNLSLITVPPFSLPRSAKILITARGSVAGTAGTKVIRLSMGASSLVISSQAAGDEQPWAFQAEITSTSTRLMALVNAYEVGGTSQLLTLAASQSSSSSYSLGVGCQLGNASDSITLDYLSISSA